MSSAACPAAAVLQHVRPDVPAAHCKLRLSVVANLLRLGGLIAVFQLAPEPAAALFQQQHRSGLGRDRVVDTVTLPVNTTDKAGRPHQEVGTVVTLADHHREHKLTSSTTVDVEVDRMGENEEPAEDKPYIDALQTYLRLELELPMGLKQIRDGPLGPLPRFLAMLRSELAVAAQSPPERVALLDIRGAKADMALLLTHAEISQADELSKAAVLEVMKVDDQRSLELLATRQLVAERSHSLHQVAETSNETAAGAAAAAEEPGALVDLELRPGRTGADPTAEELFHRIQADLAKPNSKLMRGPLGELVANGAELRRGATARSAATARISGSAGCFGSVRSSGVIIAAVVATLWSGGGTTLG